MSDYTFRAPAIPEYDPESLAVSESEAMRAVLARLRTVAATRATVLLSGETGVGKGLAARLIHLWSGRREKPFVAVHCGAIPETLIESELFGHERGSFTGAHRRSQGKFELAHEGTLFLDEVGTIPPSAQVKLLDVLQERRFLRVGGEETVEVDIRIVAASNSDLDRMQRDGAFRADLFHRLNVFPVEIPPLRDRKEDIPRLARQLLSRLGKLYGTQVAELHPTVEAAFCSYRWPGNVRELENVLERALILEATGQILPRNIPAEILNMAELHVPVPVGAERTLASVRGEAMDTAERRYLVEVLTRHGGRIDASSRTAGITPRQLRKLLTKHAIDKDDYKSPRPQRRDRSRQDQSVAQTDGSSSTLR